MILCRRLPAKSELQIATTPTLLVQKLHEWLQKERADVIQAGVEFEQKLAGGHSSGSLVAGEGQAWWVEERVPAAANRERSDSVHNEWSSRTCNLEEGKRSPATAVGGWDRWNGTPVECGWRGCQRNLHVVQTTKRMEFSKEPKRAYHPLPWSSIGV